MVPNHRPVTDKSQFIAVEDSFPSIWGWLEAYWNYSGIILNLLWLVVYLPLWKIWKSNGIIVPNIWKNIKCSKPPTSSDVFSDFFWSLSWTFPFITSHHCGGLIWNAHVRPEKSSTALFCLQAPRLLLDPWPPSWKPFVLVSCDDFNHPQWWVPVGDWSPTRQLVGGWPTPLKNISSSLGVMTFPTEWQVIKVYKSPWFQSPPTRLKWCFHA